MLPEATPTAESPAVSWYLVRCHIFITVVIWIMVIILIANIY